MNLPDGMKHALVMGANEVLLEWLESVIADPSALLAGHDLGSTYQEYMSEDVVSEADARRWLADLAPWDPGGADISTHEGVVRHFEHVQVRAGLDFARALVALATGTGTVPGPIQPHTAALAPLVDELKRSIARGSFDDASFDIQDTVWR